MFKAKIYSEVPIHQKSSLLCVQVELYERRGDPIPEGWGSDDKGELTTDPTKVLNGGGLVPIGGSEETGEVSSGEKVPLVQRIDSEAPPGGEM